MYKNLIKNYVQKLSFEDVKNYIQKNYDGVSDKEMKAIYTCIKNHWEEIYDGKEEALEDLKKQVSEKNWLEITKLLNTAKNFIQK